MQRSLVAQSQNVLINFFINLHDTVGKWLCFMTGAGVFHQSKQNNNNNG